MSLPSPPVRLGPSVLVGAASLLLASPARRAPIPPLVSPNGRIEVRVRAAERLSFDVLQSGRPLLSDSTLSLHIDGTTLGSKPRLRAARTQRVDRVVEPPVRQKAKTLRERYNELRLELEGGYAVAASSRA
jgi:alpha-glucosidase